MQLQRVGIAHRRASRGPHLSEDGAVHSPLKDASRRTSAVAPARAGAILDRGCARRQGSGRDEETALSSRTKKPGQVDGVARQGKGQTFLPTCNSEEATICRLIDGGGAGDAGP